MENIVIRYLKWDRHVERINMFQKSLLSLSSLFQVPLHELSAYEVQQMVVRDQMGLLAQIEEAFQSRSNYDVMLDSLIPRNQYVDTTELLLLKNAEKIATLSRRQQDHFATIKDKLTMLSGRKRVRGEGLNLISLESLELLSDGFVGIGSFGEVYLARWGNQVVAIKRAIDTVHQHKVIEMIEGEARIWSGLNHPNVMHLYGVGLNADRPFLVMKYMKHGSVFNYLAKYPSTPIKTRIRIMSDCAFGMAYLHSKNVIHGDLKADNILLDDDLQCCVTDFGLARVKTETNSSSKSQKGLTNAVRFIAPERYMGAKFKINEASDMFAFELDEEVVKGWIKSGKRPKRVDAISNRVWDLLELSWHNDPFQRPTFNAIATSIKLELAEYSNYISGTECSLSDHTETTSSERKPSYEQESLNWTNRSSGGDSRLSTSSHSLRKSSASTDRTVSHDMQNYQKALFHHQNAQYNQALEIWTYLAEQGHLQSMIDIAHLYLKGIGVAKNGAVTHSYLSRASDRGSIAASFKLGELYQTNTGPPPFHVQQLDKAIRYFTIAANGGHTTACHSLGVVYMMNSVYKNHQLALRFLQKASLPESHFNIGLIYYEAKDNLRAYDHFQRAISGGVKMGHLMLSKMYRDGKIGGTPNPEMQRYHLSQS
ncbi:hypothetical protein HDV03_004246 [Kappamyces sp. JEL0829]|nr:hypothetical protein HDV03_004246 [Kappamyces sp. JEL0829]